jgi:hypothetical protein
MLGPMHTLHIEISINDLPTFRASFAEHAAVRRQHGVLAERVSHPVDDGGRLLIDLDFRSQGEAEGFLDFLREAVWKGNPAIDGTPEARILEPLVLTPA